MQQPWIGGVGRFDESRRENHLHRRQHRLSHLWKQIFADVTGYSIVCPIHDVEANLDDAMLAGLGTGTFTLDEIRTWRVLDEKILPNQQTHEQYNQYYQMYHSIYRSLKKDMEHMSSIQ